MYWLNYVGPGGKMIRESARTTKYREAVALLIKRKQAVAEGKLPEFKRIGNHTFRELAVEYLKWAQRQRSFESKRGYLKQLLEAFGAYRLRQFTTKNVEQFQTARLNGGNKPATVNRLLATLKHMFSKAVDWDMVEDEAKKRVHRVKLLEENNRRLRYLSREESARLVEECDPHLRPIVVTALNTGMRKGEILSLKWDEVDLRHGFIHLTNTKNGERREIPINATLRATLKGIMRNLSIPHVFTDSVTGTPYKDVKRSFKTALRRAGIRDFRFHDLRHTFASQLVMGGVDITAVKNLLGHKTLNMTLRYAHLAPSHMAKAVAVLDSQESLHHNYITIHKKEASLVGLTP
jgi:integrase